MEDSKNKDTKTKQVDKSKTKDKKDIELVRT